MFFDYQSPEERLRIWRELRHRDFESVNELHKEFSTIKVLQRYLDYYTPSSWPNPFEIVSEGYFCKSGITLVLTATLINKNFITSENLTFLVISNTLDGSDGLVLLDRGLVYNFSDTVVTEQFAIDNSVVFTKHVVPKNQICS